MASAAIASAPATAAPFAAANLVSGPTGSGKTSLVATFAEYVWRRFGRTTLYYSCDPGGFTERLQALIMVGIVRVWRVQTRGEAFETLARASDGWWPATIDPQTGGCPRNADLLPPTLNEFTMYCAKDGTPVKKVSVQALLQPALCGKCKQMVNLQNARVTKTVRPSPTFNPPGQPQVGAIAYDGITSMSDWLMMDMADRTAKGELVGEKTALGGKIRSGEMEFGSNNRAHYGFAQLMAEKFLKNSIAIPGLVMPPLWTSLESRVDETGTELAEYGPAIAGQAKTRKVPQWVGNYLGAVIFTDKDGKRHFRLYTTEYRGDDGVPHRYKVRGEPGTLQEFYEDDPSEPPFTTFSLDRVLSEMETSLAATVEKVKARFPNAPGAGPQANLQVEQAHNPIEPLGQANAPSDGGSQGAGGSDGEEVVVSAAELAAPQMGPGVVAGAPRAVAGRVGGAGRLPVAAPARRPGSRPAPATVGARVFTPPTPGAPAVSGGAVGPVDPFTGPPTGATMNAPGAPPAAPRPPKRAAVAAPEDAGSK